MNDVRETSSSKPNRTGLMIFLGVAVAAIVFGLPLAGFLILESGKDKAKSSPLVMAVVANKPALVDELLSKNADPDETFIMGHTGLIHCARTNNVSMAERLLKAGANPNKKDTIGWAPLHHAIKVDVANCDMISLLARYKADLNVTDDHHRTPLHRAAMYGHADAVKLLLHLGADPNLKDDSSRTPFQRAAGHPEVIQLLDRTD